MVAVVVPVSVEISPCRVEQDHHLTGLVDGATGLTMVKVIMVIPTKYLADLGHIKLVDLVEVAEAQVDLVDPVELVA